MARETKITTKERKILEAEFQGDVLNSYYEWRNTCEKGSRDGVRFRGMITRLGAVETARRLLMNPSNSYRWWAIANEATWWDGVETSIEYAVLKRQFRDLFTDEEKTEAKRRLKRMRELET